MKILTYAASNSSQSINRKLINHAVEVLKAEILPDADVETIDINDYEMPIYSMDRELADGIPAKAQQFYDKIGSADALLVSYAEHNGYYTAAYKNIFDWVSRIDQQLYQGKPKVVLSASPGPGAGANVTNAVAASAPFFAADIKATVNVGHFGANFDEATNTLTDDALAADLRAALQKLV